MNKQKKYKDGKLLSRGIEWADYTWNAVGGCKHRCRWTMPDGSTAICYAEEVAESVAHSAYPHGFAHHYWRPGSLDAPLKLREPAKIFLDSMADVFGAWVPEDQINAVLSVVRQASWHTFQSLTKNAPRLLKFDFPPNMWVGASSPPDSMLGQPLTLQQQEKMLHRTLETLSRVPRNVTWVSFEPLSWDVAPIVAAHPGTLRWALVGAATNRSKVYQPDPVVVYRLLNVLDAQSVPVFFKGNLAGNPAAEPWREFYPEDTLALSGHSEAHQTALF